MITLRTSITGAVLALGLASAGCVSVLPEQPKPEAVYRLPDPQTRVELETNVVIREPDAPRLLAVRKITSQGPDGGFKVLPGVAWADRATRMFQVTLLDAFSTSGNGLAVDDVTGVSGTYEVYWRVSQFSLDGGEEVIRVSTPGEYVIVPKGFFPQQDTGRLIGFIRADQATSFQLMRTKLDNFIKIVQSGASTGEKILWVILVLVLPVVGLIIWALMGPRGNVRI